MVKNDKSWLIVAAVGVVAAAIGVSILHDRQGGAPLPPVVSKPVPSLPAPATVAEPDHHPIDNVLAVMPQANRPQLPDLDQSDEGIGNSLSALMGQALFANLFERKDIVRRIVATIDNLPRESVAPRMWPLKPAAGHFLVGGKDETLAIAPENALRYTPYLQLVQAADTQKLVELYVQNYALFQQAYQQLGYPNGYFNDRLIVVIDHLLKTPAATDPQHLLQPHVLYVYANPDLEALSFGQKTLLRMGSDNEAAIKAKLSDIRRLLVREAPPKPR